MVAKETLRNWLADFDVMEPQGSGALQVFGLRKAAESPLSYKTLDEALQEDVVEVTEVSDSGEVPNLRVTNKGESMVFLMAGEELIGAKQNRVLNASLLVGAHSDTAVPVSCVEQGRWRYRSPKFGSGGSSAHRKLRAKLSSYASEAYSARGEPRSNQGEVWKEVSAKLLEMKSPSPSAALHQAYDDHEKTLDGMCREVPPPEGALGAVFVIGGKVAGVDIFDRPETLRKLWQKIVRAAGLDALPLAENEDRLTRDEVRSWLERSRAADLKEFKSPGLGDDVRLDSKEYTGGGLVFEEQPVHTELFSAVK